MVAIMRQYEIIVQEMNLKQLKWFIKKFQSDRPGTLTEVRKMIEARIKELEK